MNKFILAAIVLAHASHASDVKMWLEHENIREGVPAAYELCQGKSLNRTITFSFKDNGIHSLLTVTCKDIIDYVNAKKSTTA